MSTDNIEEGRPLTVSERRRQFESLSREGSSSSSSLSTPVSSNIHDTAPEINRQRALSTAGAPLDTNVSSSDRHLRQSSSNSELNASRRPVPPPPPPRTPKPKLLSPLASPNMRPTIVSSNSAPVPLLQADKQILISRKPPPPPSPSSSTLAIVQTSRDGRTEVISVKDRAAAFAVSGPSHPSTRPSSSSARIVSHPGFIPPKPPDGPIHQPRHSLSGHPPLSPIIRLHSPPPTFQSNEVGSPVPSAPPLPARPTHRSQLVESSESQNRGGLSYNVPYPSETSVDESSDSDQTADADDRSIRSLVLSPPPRHPPKQPPRHPPRHTGSLPNETIVSTSNEVNTISSGSSTPTLQVPPPLPARRSPPSSARGLPPLRPSIRSKSLHDQVLANPSPASATSSERKSGVGHLPPPPTRTIALGEKPPIARIPPSNEGSNSDSDEDEETSITGGRPVDLLPDSSNSSRRPPMLPSPAFRDMHPHVAAHSGLISVAGSHVVVVSHNHIKIFDLSISITPLHDIALKDLPIEWRMKDPRVTSMEFRPAELEAEHGRFLWFGARDGVLWELDIYTGVVTSIHPAAHSNAITHVLRHGNNMITIDENGKALIFSPEADGFGNMLAHSQPRVVRISDKQGFVKIIGGMLWTSGGPASGSSNSSQGVNNGAAARGPLIRVYDILSQNTLAKSLLPLEHVGSVTSGTLLQTHPGKAFLGHEGGVVTIWDLKVDDGYPSCIEVVKVSTTDVLCLEGVYNRLWAGSRNGAVVAYDIEAKPWIVTNSWSAHEGPVNRLFVDPYSIEKCGQLTVITVGRDEKAKFWDGLLGLEWIDGELNKQESSFSSFRDLKVLVASWNVDAAKPDALSGFPENNEFLGNVIGSVDSPDIIAFGFQELIDLESRKMAAKTVLLGGKKKSNGAISEKVSRSYKLWYDKLVLAVRLVMPPDCPYTVVHAENLVGLFSCIFMKSSERNGLNDVSITTIKRGIGGMYGNKGAIVARLVIDDSSLCFINCHLAAGQHHVRSRNADIAAILDEKGLFPSSASSERVAYVGGGDGSMVMDHEIVFLNGDLNYRIDQRREAVISAVHSGQFDQLLAHDQLRKELSINRAFRLRDFVEAPITFAPTYKYDRRSSQYDSSEKSRVPAWCDRILYRCRHPSRVQNLHYQRYEANISDHRPISSAFKVTVKSVDYATRARTKSVIEGLWSEQQHHILSETRSYLLSSEII